MLTGLEHGVRDAFRGHETGERRGAVPPSALTFLSKPLTVLVVNVTELAAAPVLGSSRQMSVVSVSDAVQRSFHVKKRGRRLKGADLGQLAGKTSKASKRRPLGPHSHCPRNDPESGSGGSFAISTRSSLLIPEMRRFFPREGGERRGGFHFTQNSAGRARLPVAIRLCPSFNSHSRSKGFDPQVAHRVSTSARRLGGHN